VRPVFINFSLNNFMDFPHGNSGEEDPDEEKDGNIDHVFDFEF